MWYGMSFVCHRIVLEEDVRRRSAETGSANKRMSGLSKSSFSSHGTSASQSHATRIKLLRPLPLAPAFFHISIPTSSLSSSPSSHFRLSASHSKYSCEHLAPVVLEYLSFEIRGASLMVSLGLSSVDTGIGRSFGISSGLISLRGGLNDMARLRSAARLQLDFRR